MALLAAVALAAGSARAEQVVIDDFEGYASGDVVAASAQSTPWSRYGYSVNDNPIASSQQARVLAGNISCAFAVGWGQTDVPARNSATLRYTFESPTDLSVHASLSATLRSLLPTTAGTSVRLLVSDGTTTFAFTKPVAITNDAQTATFELLSPADYERTDGSASWNDVLKQAKSVALRFENKTVESNETLVIDDVVLD